MAEVCDDDDGVPAKSYRYDHVFPETKGTQEVCVLVLVLERGAASRTHTPHIPPARLPQV